MKHLLTYLGTVILTMTANSAMAGLDAADFDLNENEHLEPSEVAALKTTLATWPNQEERAAYNQTFSVLTLDDKLGQPIPLIEFENLVSTRKCSADQSGFLIRNTLDDVPIAGCQTVQKTSGGSDFVAVESGAFLAYKRDFVADTEEFTFKGAFGYLFTAPNSGKDSRQGNLSDWGLLAYLQADGTMVSNAPDPGTVEAGLRAEFVFDGNTIVKTVLGLTPYYITDFDFEANAWGLKASLTPFAAKYRLNGSRKGAYGSYAYFVVKPSLDMLSVNDAGNTMLTSGTSYTWIGGQFGIAAFTPKIGGDGLKFEAGVRAYNDLRGNQSAIQRYANADLFLNENRTVALRASYVDGRDRYSLSNTETLNIGLGFAF